MKPGDYVVAVPTIPTDDPAWDIGVVRNRQSGNKVTVEWLLADERYTEYADESIRVATPAEYDYARWVKGIDP